MKKTFAKVGALVLFMLAGHSADAGNKAGPITVFINDATREAGGQIGAVRASSDSTQWISCTVEAQTDITNPSVICAVTDGAGNYRSCVTTAAKFVQPALAAVNDSYITFKWGTSGLCERISVTLGSQYQTKQP